MRPHHIQEELFASEQYLRACGECRNSFPRTLDFFPEGRCSDGLSSLCRKCQTTEMTTASPTPPPARFEHRACECCGESRTLAQFYMDSKGPAGKSWVCKSCHDLQLNPVLPPEMPYGLCFVQDVRNRRVCLLVTSQPQQRLQQLQEGASVPLRFLAVQGFSSEAQAESQMESLMQCFEKQQVYGSWLEESELLIRWIEGIQPAKTAAPAPRQAIVG